MRGRGWTRVIIFCLGISALGLAPAHAAAVQEHGYLTVRDGTRLRYHVMYPAAPAGGRFPVLLNHEGYAAGTNARDNGLHLYADEILRRGYALLGVSVRGTGCSQGAFDPFEPVQARDAYDIVEWAGTTPNWSDGRVGMIGLSFGGIMQLLAAQERPPHLLAIAPSSVLVDLYRDVAFPGGILNTVFPLAWPFIQKAPGTVGVRVPVVEDDECATNYVQHEIANTDYFVPKMLLDAPYADDPLSDGTSFFERSPVNGLPRIEVPTLLFGSWQDEQLMARVFEFLGSFGNQDRLWINLSNGHHGRDYYSPQMRELTIDFLDHFVQGIDNGFETSQPPLSLGMETTPEVNAPSWSIDLPINFQPTPREFFLGPEGGLNASQPAAGELPDAYVYPMPSADVLEAGSKNAGGIPQTGQYTWKAPPPPIGALTYTTEPLAEDLVVAGPASLDVWLSSTADDTDLQVTVTEVRPDGMETYVQRGWLRASHRKLDPELSTPLRPYQTHKRADAALLTPGEPELMRVEVFPFAHAFRAGSRLRVWIDAPTGRTGLWGFAYTPDPATNTIHHDAAHPSKLVVGVIPGQAARTPLPACDSLLNQPCRRDPIL